MPIGTFERKKEAVIRITETQNERLKAVAARLHCIAGTGPTAGKPSWRVMLLGIAEGVLVVRNPKDKSAKKERRAKRKMRRIVSSNTPGAPNWWQPIYGNAMGLDYALKVSGLALPELLTLGLRSEFNPLLRTPEILVGRPEWASDISQPQWWWQPIADGTMLAEDAAEKAGISRETLVASGHFVLSDCGQWLGKPL